MSGSRQHVRPRLPRLARVTRLLPGTLAGFLAAMPGGCSQLPVARDIAGQRALVARGVEAELPQGGQLPERIAVPQTTFASEPAEVREQQKAKQLPINLETVFRLAEDQNSQLALARARVREACAEKDVAAKAWLPAVYAGTAYYRH